MYIIFMIKKNFLYKKMIFIGLQVLEILKIVFMLWVYHLLEFIIIILVYWFYFILKIIISVCF